MALKMIGLLSLRIILRHPTTRRHFCAIQGMPKKSLNKLATERQMRYEAKLQTIKEFVIKENLRSEGNIDWKQIVSEMANQRLVSKFNFEVDLMSAFLLNNETDSQIDKKLFESMTKFIKTVPNIVNNSIASSRYYHFISHFHQYIDESDIKMIRQTSDQLVAEYMDNKLTGDVLKHVIIGLSKSSKDNCLHSIRILDQINKIEFSVIKEIIESTLTFKLFDQTLYLMQKYSDIRLSDTLITKVVKSLIECNPSEDQMIEILRTLSNDLIVFDSNLKTNFVKTLENNSFKIRDTFVAQNGLCLKCEQRLGTVSAEEQHILLKDFKSVVFNKENDLLMKSFPEYRRELKFFDKFIEKITEKQALDLVIDGLNMAFLINPEVVEDKKKLRKFIRKYRVNSIDDNIVEILTKNNIQKYENILIVGRNHMKEWKRLNQLLERHKHQISVFYAMNKTQDDCYILYASLRDVNTYLISNDFYRDFVDKMAKKGPLFQRWLQTHQILTRKHSKEFIFPDLFEHKIHISEDNNTIHIPFQSEDNKIDWICCQKTIY